MRNALESILSLDEMLGNGLGRDGVWDVVCVDSRGVPGKYKHLTKSL
jgi:hypothetical protein